MIVSRWENGHLIRIFPPGETYTHTTERKNLFSFHPALPNKFFYFGLSQGRHESAFIAI